ncbi:MAG: M56 family metallopeptidase, partial [Candidatus Marinimicrobia bacterium]|nr:M56 family metallopeptidase [Candidatus Neomarinimicrobiota bacterium]
MNNFIFSINQIADTWYSIIVPHSFQLLILFGILITVNFLFKKQSAIFGYGLWLIFIIKALIPMKIALFTNNEAVSKIVYINELVTKSLVVQPETKLQFSYESVLFLIWILGILFLISRLIFTEFSFRKILNNSKEIVENKILFQTKNKIDIKKKVQLFSSEKIPAPFTIGIFKPKIFIPYELLNSDEKQLKSILAHELAHIKRLDIIPIFMQTFVNIFYFFNPFIWLANRHINFYRERVCDEIALTNLGIEPSNYGKTLLTNLELLFVKKTKPIFANNLFQTKKIIIRRLESLFKNKEKIMLKLKKTQWMFLIILAILTVMLSCEKKNVKKKDPVNKTEYDSPAIPSGNTGKIIIDNNPNGKNEKVSISVDAKVLISKKGVVKECSESGYSGIVKATKRNNMKLNISEKQILETIKNTKFRPALKDGKPIEAWMEIPITIQFFMEKDDFTSVSSKVKFVPYDVPPKPIGGRDAIMKNIVYPEKAKKAGIEGKVIIQSFINEKGIVTDCVVIEEVSIKNKELRESAIDALKKTKFTPGKQRDKIVGVWIAVPIDFKLKNGGKNETVITNPPEESFEEMKKIIIDNHSNGENE